MKRPSFDDIPIIEIGPGEHYVGTSGVVIKTLLGSCVAVCLYDPIAKVIGMNHFLLAADNLKRADILDSRAGHYGMHAMESVINSMSKLGANKNRIQSKVFGGGNVVKQLIRDDGDFKTVGDQNIAFAFEFLKRERIPIQKHDVGGKCGRIIYFDSNDFSVYRSLINHQCTTALENKEQRFYQHAKKQVSKKPPTIKIWD